MHLKALGAGGVWDGDGIKGGELFTGSTTEFWVGKFVFLVLRILFPRAASEKLVDPRRAPRTGARLLVLEVARYRDSLPLKTELLPSHASIGTVGITLD